MQGDIPMQMAHRIKVTASLGMASSQDPVKMETHEFSIYPSKRRILKISGGSQTQR